MRRTACRLRRRGIAANVIAAAVMAYARRVGAKMNRRSLLSAGLVCLASGPALARGEYTGADAGILVVSFGSLGEQAAGYTIWYKPRAEKPGWFPDIISYDPSSFLFNRTPDYTGHEIGQVHILHLKPGEYDFYRAAIFNPVGIQLSTWNSPDFSLPFTIKPGEVTYAGDIAGSALWKRGLFISGYYVVSDQHERDLEIARKKDTNLPAAVTIAVPDVSGMADKALLPQELPTSE